VVVWRYEGGVAQTQRPPGARGLWEAGPLFLGGASCAAWPVVTAQAKKIDRRFETTTDTTACGLTRPTSSWVMEVEVAVAGPIDSSSRRVRAKG
jgi:hypothetical protein